MRRQFSCVALVAGLLLVASSSSTAAELLPDDLDFFFEKQVRPLLVKRCFECHGGAKSSGGLSLGSAAGWQKGGDSGPAIVPGKPEESLLIAAINYRSLEMPPVDKGGKLPDDEIAVLTKWVAMRAPDPRTGGEAIGGMTREEANIWWAFQPLPVTGAVADLKSGVQHIDRLLQTEIDRQGLSIAAPADRRTFVRRITYDLTGLPPTPADVKAFLADQSPEAVATLIDRLLDSPQYGVQWGRHWLDIVRYADTAGENTDRPLPHAWRYRNWVIDAFNRDLPFDQFVTMQIAGDKQSLDFPQRTDGIIATGYLAISRRFGHDIDKDMYLTYEDVIDNLGKNFLGLALGCARCHDHKYDPVSSEDYYALYGIFESTRFAFPGCEPKGQPRDLVPLIDPAEMDAMQADYQQKLAKYEELAGAAQRDVQRLKQLAADSSRTLAEATVEEGQSVSMLAAGQDRLMYIAMRKGEVLQLTVLPNANHGADTTRVELEITAQKADRPRVWNPELLVDRFVTGGPAIEQDGAIWCLLDVAEGPQFLHEKKEQINGKLGLNGWAIGDTPSSIVNANMNALEVWTRLPPRAFFVHPGHQRSVAVAWICPEDGAYRVRGTVTDAHPAGLDGVSFRLEHIASSDFGTGLVKLGSVAATQRPQPPEPPAIPVAYAVIDGEPKNARFQDRGDPEKPSAEIPRRWLSVFGGAEVPTGAGSGRRELSQWISVHPLTARVMANRIWEWHFGRGLVPSSNDFGSRGERATHPELLDWLAAQFVESGYSVKFMHRLILQTAAYHRASEAMSAADPENRWLAHFRRRRLTAEEIRDSLLAVSGQLDLTPGEAHPFPPEKTWSFTQHAPFNAVYETNRRSAYLMVQRQRRHPFLAIFDGADPNASTPARQTTTVPTQALYFINDPFFHAQAAAFAQLMLSLPEDEVRLTQMYHRLFERDPSTDERERMQRFLGSYPSEMAEKWSALARVLMASNEFLHVD
jgi:hypothetical protein